MIFKTAIRVRYSETDQMGVVYHGNYFTWFEVGRVEMLRTLGFSYRELEAEENCILPVVEASCRYRQPARYDDLLELQTTVKALRGPILIFSYGLYRDVLLLAEGETKHVVVDGAMQRRKLPERHQQALLRSMGSEPTSTDPDVSATETDQTGTPR